jgi:hypothetical protein
MGELDNDLASEIRNNLRAHASAHREWRRKAKESYDFVASEQWTDEEKEQLQASSRTPIVFNRVARTINAVIGLELQNRQEISYKPVSNQSTGINDLMNAASKWARSNCDAEDEESESFADLLTCGVGVTETLMDYKTDLDGMVVVERRDPLECAADHRAKKRNYDDATWVACWRSYSKDEFEAMYPGVEATGADLVALDNGDQQIDHNDDEYKYGEEQGVDKDSPYTIVKYQYSKDEEVYRIPINQEIKTLSAEEYAAIKPMLDLQGIEGQKQAKRVFKQVLICRNTILEETDSPIDGFTIRFMTGLRDRNRNIWFGLVELMKDPQRWANKWLSQIQFILNSNAKGGIIHEASVFTNPKKAKADWAKPNAWIEVVKGAITEGRIKDRTPPQYPDGIDRLLQQALTAINDVPGVNVEMLGIADRNQPGMIENSRKDAGVTILASFFDALRRYRKEQGRVMMQFIINYISDGRLIRIDGANANYVPLLKQDLTAKYDILVDDAPTSPNMKEKTFGAVSSMLQVALQAGIPVPPEILEYSPLPSALVDKWTALINEQKTAGEDPEKEAMKQTIGQMQEQLKAAISELEDKTEENQVKLRGDDLKYQADMRNADIKAYQAETDRMKLTMEPVAAPDPIAMPEMPAPQSINPVQGGAMPLSERELIAQIEEIRAKKAEEESKAAMESEKEAREYQQREQDRAERAAQSAEIIAAINNLTNEISRPKYVGFDDQTGMPVSIN